MSSNRATLPHSDGLDLVMDDLHHRRVFSWPHGTWTHTDKDKASQLTPESLGVKIISQDVMKELSAMAAQAREDKRDETIAIFDLGTVVERFKQWRECFPKIRPFYAVKAHDDPAVVCTLNHLGAGFDCASKEELELALKCGVAESNIIYANPVKFPSHLAFASSINVKLMTVDNEEELLKIKRLFPKAKLVLRLEVQNGCKVELELTDKFGCSQEGATRLLQLACQLKLDVVGVSFHVGSGCDDPKAYIKNIRVARKVFNDALREGFHLRLLDIGGGFFGKKHSELTLQKMCGPINDTLEQLFPESSGVRVIAEPGRYFVESGLVLAVCVIGKRIMLDKSVCKEPTERLQNGKALQEASGFEYYISESVYGLFNINLVIDDYIKTPLPMRTRSVDAEMYTSRLWGPTCDSIDLVKERCSLPELEMGEWLVFPDMGAYSVVLASTFNGMPIPTVHRIIRQDVWDQLVTYSAPTSASSLQQAECLPVTIS